MTDAITKRIEEVVFENINETGVWETKVDELGLAVGGQSGESLLESCHPVLVVLVWMQCKMQIS